MIENDLTATTIGAFLETIKESSTSIPRLSFSAHIFASDLLQCTLSHFLVVRRGVLCRCLRPFRWYDWSFAVVLAYDLVWLTGCFITRTDALWRLQWWTTLSMVEAEVLLGCDDLFVLWLVLMIGKCFTGGDYIFAIVYILLIPLMGLLSVLNMCISYRLVFHFYNFVR